MPVRGPVSGGGSGRGGELPLQGREGPQVVDWELLLEALQSLRARRAPDPVCRHVQDEPRRVPSVALSPVLRGHRLHGVRAAAVVAGRDGDVPSLTPPVPAEPRSPGLERDWARGKSAGMMWRACIQGPRREIGPPYPLGSFASRLDPLPALRHASRPHTSSLSR